MRKNQRKKKKNIELMWLIFIGVALVIGILESKDLYKDMKSTNWPKTYGKANTSNVAHYVGGTPRQAPIRSSLDVQRKTSYSYTVNKRNYTSENKSFGYTFSERFEPYSSQDSPTQSPYYVKVYYNPNNPNEAVLLPGPKLLNVLFIILSVSITVICVQQFRRTLSWKKI